MRYRRRLIESLRPGVVHALDLFRLIAPPELWYAGPPGAQQKNLHRACKAVRLRPVVSGKAVLVLHRIAWRPHHSSEPVSRRTVCMDAAIAETAERKHASTPPQSAVTAHQPAGKATPPPSRYEIHTRILLTERSPGWRYHVFQLTVSPEHHDAAPENKAEGEATCA